MVSEDRLNTSPQPPAIPKTTQLITDLPKDSGSKSEAKSHTNSKNYGDYDKDWRRILFGIRDH